MLTHQGCPQTPGGRIRALGFARMGARGRRRGPIPAVCHRYSSPVLYQWPWTLTRPQRPQTPGGRMGTQSLEGTRCQHYRSLQQPSSLILLIGIRDALKCRSIPANMGRRFYPRLRLVPLFRLAAMTDFTGLRLTCLRGERLVFVGLTFQLAAGGALVLAGPNASGKSSLLRLMASLLRPWRGELRWNGAPVADDLDAHRARLRYVGHLDAIKPMLTAEETLGFWAPSQSRLTPAKQARQALERFGLDRLATVPTRYFSAGQKRRLNLARLLLAPARLWLLDEPTVGLDHAAIVQLGEVLAEHRSAGGMVVAATHTDLPLPGADHLRMDDFAFARPLLDEPAPDENLL